MKVSFIVVYTSTKTMCIFDKIQWPTPNIELDVEILSNTLFLLNQISTIPIEKEILLMDNTGDFPEDFYCDDLKVIKTIGSWNEDEFSQNIFIFDNVKDNVPKLLSKHNQASTCSLAYQHGVSLATGDYIIMQHNDTKYLFDYYDKKSVITDAIQLLEKNNYEYITVDKKPIKQRDFPEWNDKLEYFADCYWFLCKSDFYKKHNIWVDWIRGDSNHLSTITCVNKGLKFLHLPLFYEGTAIDYQCIKEYNEKYPEFKKDSKNYHLLNDIPFLIHFKGGTGLRSFIVKK